MNINSLLNKYETFYVEIILIKKQTEPETSIFVSESLYFNKHSSYF